jgi:hypothetical protein
VPDVLAVYADDALLVVLVPVAVVPCQYQVSPAGGVPVAVNVFDPQEFAETVGVGGAVGLALTVTTTDEYIQQLPLTAPR